MNYSTSLRAAALLEYRRRQRLKYKPPHIIEFAGRTKIETPQDKGQSVRPFFLWESQKPVIDSMLSDRLLVILKARQLGISWLACLYSLYQSVSYSSQTILALSQGQMEANELIRRVGFLYDNHQDNGRMPKIVGQNTKAIRFENGSRIQSLPATQKAGRSFTASNIILDEYAFMQWNAQLFSAAKPAIDNGGQMMIISSADGNGSHYHQFWQNAQAGANGFKPIFLPWDAHPDRGDGWRDRQIKESHEDSDIYREYPETPEEAFTHASGLVYKVWSESENVTTEAEYIPGGGEVYWAVDDGYAGRFDNITGYYTADSHPRVFLLCQLRADGRLCVFDESYEVGMLSNTHTEMVSEMPYDWPVFAGVDKSAAELKGQLNNTGVFTRNGPSDVEETIKLMRRWIAKDKNGWRRILVHPRCHHLRGDFRQYRRDQNTGRLIKKFDHGPDALRYLVWSLRLME